MKIAHDTMVLLCDYPLLAKLAARRTQAVRLYARACRFVYDTELVPADLHDINDKDRDLMALLDVSVPKPPQSVR